MIPSKKGCPSYLCEDIEHGILNDYDKLWLAVTDRNSAQIKQLLNDGINSNAVDFEGHNILFNFFDLINIPTAQDKEIITLLIDHGVSPYLRPPHPTPTWHNFNALERASKCNMWREIVPILQQSKLSNY